jgi:hypothetical protein
MLGQKNSTISLHCGKKIGSGGITQLKYHLAGKKRSVKWQMKQLIGDIEKNDERRKRTRNDIGSIGCADPGSQEGSTSVSDSRGKPPSAQSCPSATQPLIFFPENISYTATKREEFLLLQGQTGSQPSIKSALATKDMVENARNAMA